MKNNKRFIGIVIAVFLLGAVVGGLLVVGEPLDAFEGITDAREDALEGEDTPITGEALEQASEAALEYLRENGMGEGQVTDTEVGDEEGYYEIEVTLDEGGQVDVHLTEEFEVLSQVEDVEND